MQKIERPEDEINYTNLIKKPIRLIGLIYPIILILIIVIGMYWVYNLDNAYLNRIPAVKLTRDTVAAPIPLQMGVIQPGVKIIEVANSTPELIAKGKELFTTNCVSCHGAGGKGDGVAGAALNPKPRNLTSVDGWKNGRKLSEMWKTLEEGVPGGGMVSYNFMPILDRFALIHYIHSLMAEFPANTPDELAQLDLTYKLSEGKVTPNQIPVAKALSVLINENQDKIISSKQIIKKIEESTEKGKDLFNNVVYNKNKAIDALMKNSEWTASPELFYLTISNTINVNGFKSEFLRLNRNDLQILFEMLNRNIKG